MLLSKRTHLHQSARIRNLAQQPARSGVSIGLGSPVILAAAQLVRPFAAPLNVHNPEED
jgi:hypothetical protein